MSSYVTKLPQEEIDSIFKDWVSALRSGKYRQGKNVLRTADDRYCCLGVLCEIMVQRKHLPPPQLDEKASIYFYKELDTRKEARSLPVQVAAMLGVTATVAGGDVPLSALNDRGDTFEEIADVIERDMDHFFRYASSTRFIY